MSSGNSALNDPLAHYSRNVIEDHHRTLALKYGVRMPSMPLMGPSASNRTFSPAHPPYETTKPPVCIPDTAPVVGIIGAGIGGLYAAYLLQELGIPYEILEASPRLGGRLFTQKMGYQPYDYFVSTSYAVEK